LPEALPETIPPLEKRASSSHPEIRLIGYPLLGYVNIDDLRKLPGKSMAINTSGLRWTSPKDCPKLAVWMTGPH
jgi:hypothetical protein